MISATRAKAEGYTIDNHAAGRPVAYKGNRFAPTEMVKVLTDEEEQLLAVLAPIASMITYYKKNCGARETYTLQLGADAAKQIVDTVNEVWGAK